ncbi:MULTISPECIES: SDR family oxidoreductase [Methylomonas]|uniref:Short-chain dehydrogenase n=2 Tax=Methylomonas TaxID=416 RepID=A0A126T3T3_9GAMM|nr:MULTISPECIES: SDR family NAD(P)-dependent oxidoreductase [Methylomonas]AMK76741.1 short-chain dehydrogenase [Methylomonas denitrificans]OAI00018.1 short-chain dehydrogenase [Methylomonas methanica]TCV82765.1 NADP-dependent 3-hydroxy acid dehydrogenase YdfG [Methylomonas methanica]
MHTVKRTVLVTGASSGIGRAIAQQLLAQGHKVIGTSRDCRRFSKLHPNFIGVELDLEKLTDLPPFAKQLQSDFPALDAAVFAAGYGQFGGLEQFSYAQIESLMTVNFTAQACLTRALLPKLKQKPHANLVYIGSEAALKGSRNGSIYCASKFALRGFSQALRDECGKSSVRVSLVNPGMVDTAFFDTLAFAPGKQSGQALMADDVADAVSYILQAGPHCVIDELNLNPSSKVIEFKK